MSRSSKFPRFLVVIILVLVLAAGFTLAISAQDPDDGEPNEAGPAGPAQETVHEEEIGIQNQQAGGAATDGNGEPERQPATTTSVVQEEVGNTPNDPGMATFFKRWAAETFVAYDSSNTWAYDGGGCFHRTGGSTWWDTDLQLPDGAEIDYLRVYYYDMNGTTDAETILFQFDDIGGNVQLASAAGSGTPGYSSAGSGFFSHFVDNTDHSYVLRIDFNGATTSDLRICAVRIRYQYNVATLSLPAIMNLTSP
ncbi:MAG: hypothetical protein L0332_26455 [Chloroflexi bacterium]|nr:hypothetical protein [Chloroflexota bacterium]MCI0577871.1 hypothetical protein [Chloroflexota bacterium]MCI0644493.1 hypothetical protein [Chloroflexota bacterium]MCI0730239.1 hypothetical protein [Chloroflexota bacterium]